MRAKEVAREKDFDAYEMYVAFHKTSNHQSAKGLRAMRSTSRIVPGMHTRTAPSKGGGQVIECFIISENTRKEAPVGGAGCKRNGCR